MSGCVNRVLLIGHLGGDPQSKATGDGRRVVWFSIATSDTWRDKATGERKQRTEWHNVVIFNDGLCDIAIKYLHKGSKAYIEGEQRTRKWTDQGGAERRVTEVVLPAYRGAICLLDRVDRSPPGDEHAYGNESAPAPDVAAEAAKPAIDDEIPF